MNSRNRSCEIHDEKGGSNEMEKKLHIKRCRMTYDSWNQTLIKRTSHLWEDRDYKYNLMEIEKVVETQYWEVFGEQVMVADDGYQWFVLAPKEEYFVISMMLDRKQSVILWYLDMIDGQGVDDEGIYYYDDIFLDLVVSRKGEFYIDDRDELDLAYESGVLSQQQYDLALRTMDQLIGTMKEDKNWLHELCFEALKRTIVEIEKGMTHVVSYEKKCCILNDASDL